MNLEEAMALKERAQEEAQRAGALFKGRYEDAKREWQAAQTVNERMERGWKRAHWERLLDQMPHGFLVATADGATFGLLYQYWDQAEVGVELVTSAEEWETENEHWREELAEGVI